MYGVVPFQTWVSILVFGLVWWDCMLSFGNTERSEREKLRLVIWLGLATFLTLWGFGNLVKWWVGEVCRRGIGTGTGGILVSAVQTIWYKYHSADLMMMMAILITITKDYWGGVRVRGWMMRGQWQRSNGRQSSHKSYNDESSLSLAIMASTLHSVTLMHNDPYDDADSGK